MIALVCHAATAESTDATTRLTFEKPSVHLASIAATGRLLQGTLGHSPHRKLPTLARTPSTPMRLKTRELELDQTDTNAAWGKILKSAPTQTQETI